MHTKRCFALWFGFLFLAAWLLPLLAAEAQVRVSDRSNNPVPSFAPSSSSLTQPTVDVPANATLDYTGHEWECKRGYRRSGNECGVVDVPAHASIDYTGHEWECKHGYHQSGNECIVVHLPANATLDYIGHGWECETGYRRVGDACETMTALPKTARYGSLAVQESRVHPQQPNDFKEEIRQIQEQLKQAGFDPGPMDGILGPQTMQALHLYLAR